jgi:hypothetical protein
MLYGRCCLPTGKGKLWPPPEQKPSNRSIPNLASMITSQGSPNVPSLVDVTSPAAARRRGGLSRLCDFFRTFFFFFAGSRTAQTDSRIIIVDGSNNPVWCKEVPFVQKCQKKFIYGVQSTKNGVIFRRIGINEKSIERHNF